MQNDMLDDKRKINILFASLQGFFWCSYCSFFSYMVLYFRMNGYKESTIGIIMMIQAIVSVFAPMFLGYLADFKIPVKRIVNVCLLLAIPSAFLLKISVSILPAAMLSIAIMGFLERSMVSIMDSWGMKIRDTNVGLNFGVARGVGSATFAISGLAFGRLYDVTGIDSIFWVHAIFCFITFVLSLFIMPIPISENAAAKISYTETIKRLWKNKTYVTVVFCLTLSGLRLVAVGTYMPILIVDLGGTAVHIGIAYFVLSMSEVPLMFSFSRIASKYKASMLLSVSFFFIIIRIVSNVLAPNLTWLIGVQVFQSISYGLYLPALLMFISQITDDDIRSSAIAIAFAVGDGLPGIVGNAAGSVIAEFYGVQTVYYVFAAAATISFIVFTSKITWRRI